MILLALRLWIALFPPGSESGVPSISDADRVRLAEAFRLADAASDAIWPGWSRVPFAVLLVTGEREFLLRHPSPTADFRRLGRDETLGSEVYARARTLSPNLLATFPVGGVSTVVVGQAERTGLSATAWVVTLLHEHFHQMQESQPGFYAKVQELGLARGDTTGMWMLEYAFPYRDPRIGERFGALTRALARQDPKAVRNAWNALQKALSADDFRYLEFQLWKEGVARYTELQVALWAARDFTPGAAFRALPDFEAYGEVAATTRGRIQKELVQWRLAENRREIFYATGAALALLLDRASPGWRRQYFASPLMMAPLVARSGGL